MFTEKRISLKFKFLLIPIAAALGFSLFIIFSINISDKNALRLKAIQNVYMPLIEKANSNIARLEQISELIKSAVATDESTMLTKAGDIAADFNDSMQKIDKMDIKDQSILYRIDLVEKSFKHYYDSALEISTDIIEGNIFILSEIGDSALKMNELLNKTREELLNFQSASYKRFDESIREANDAATRGILLGLAIGLITVFIILITGLSVTGLVTRNINNIVSSFKLMERDESAFTKVIECKSFDEVGDLVTSFNRFINHLRGIINVVSDQKKEIELLNSKLEQKVEELHILATTDKLTGLKNYAFFYEEIEKRINEYQRVGKEKSLSLVIMDLDLFKNFNDTYGHVAGNVALQETAKCVLKHARKMDTACRYGGEEFSIVLPLCDIEGASKFGERIRNEVLQRPIKIDGKTVSITTSVGCTEYIPNEHADDFIKRADSALYQAKEDGRNKVVADKG